MISPRLVQLIAERDFWAIVQTKSFLIGLAAFAFIASVMPGVAVLSLIEADYRVAIIDQTGRYAEPLKQKYADNSTYTLEEVPAASDTTHPEAAAEALAATYERVRRQEIDGLVVIEPGVTPGEEIFTFASASLADPNLQRTLKNSLTGLLRNQRALAMGMTPEQVERLLAPMDFQLERITDEPVAQKANEMDIIIAMFIPVVLVFALYGLISFQSERLLTALMEEKMKRLLEVLLTRVTIYELLAGKMLGILYVGFLLYFGVLGLLLTAAWTLGFLSIIPPKIILFFTLFYAAGYFLYASFYAAIGAACSHPKDAENLSMPLRMLLVVPIMISVYVNVHPNAETSLFFSFFPLTAPFVMTNRMMVLQIPAWELALSLVLVLIAAAIGLWAATRIFQASLLAGSRTLGFREVLQSLRG